MLVARFVMYVQKNQTKLNSVQNILELSLTTRCLVFKKSYLIKSSFSVVRKSNENLSNNSLGSSMLVVDTVCTARIDLI